jgi:hypothetical protein
MAFTVAIVQAPASGERREDLENWAAFPELANIHNMKTSDGMLCVGKNAWIFNMRKAITAYARVVTQAEELGFQLTIVHLDESSLHSNVYAAPHSEALSNFFRTP